jgi:hypothetical protein
MAESAIVHVDPDDVGNRLAQMGLTQEVLWSTVLEGYVARQTCTELDPPSFRGFTGWAVTTRALRKRLLAGGWEMSNSENYALTISREKALAIAIATGDSETGVLGGNPRTNSEKGPKTLAAICVNREQLELFERNERAASPQDDQPLQTWILLVTFEGPSIRAELSLPNGWDEDGRISDWRERIVLSGDDATNFPLRLPEPGPDFDVDVTRRVG